MGSLLPVRCICGVSFRGLQSPRRAFQEPLHSELGLSEQRCAALVESDAPFVQAYRTLQRQTALLEFGDGPLKFQQRLIERQGGYVGGSLSAWLITHRATPPGHD
jgi:hypothetical protein